MTYDYTTEPHKPDVLVELIERMMNEFSQAAVPLAWPVDLLPVLRYLPEYLPGVQFKKVARKWRRTIRAVGYIPYRYVLRQMAANSFKTSYTSKVIQQLSPKREGELSFQDQEAVVWTAASLYGGASDTTVVVLTTFTLAMIMFPHVQQKAHEELDQVVGRGRLPGFEDRDNLPYINAIVKEAFRWWPIAPMGFPHMVDEELEYNGLRIPKGAFLIPAVWSFLHDPEVYANPHAFEPERFLSPRDEPDPSSEAFGYGRRICPGRFFADASIYLNIVSTLAAFRIDAAVDKEGKKIPIDVHATAGILNHPSEFKFKISLRSPEYDEIIRRVEVEHPWEKCDVDLLEGDGLKPE